MEAKQNAKNMDTDYTNDSTNVGVNTKENDTIAASVEHTLNEKIALNISKTWTAFLEGW